LRFSHRQEQAITVTDAWIAIDLQRDQSNLLIFLSKEYADEGIRFTDKSN